MTPEQIKELQAEVAKNKLAAKAAEVKLAEYKGIDPEHYKTLKAEVEAMNRDAKAAELHKLAAQGDYDTFKARYDVDRESEIQELRDQLAAEQEKIKALEQQQVEKEQKRKNNQIEKELSAALQQSGAINPKIVKQLIADTHEIELEETDDEATAYAVDKNSNIKLSVKQLVSDLRTSNDYAHLFSEPATALINPWRKDTLNLTEQGKISRKNPELARRLMSEAADAKKATDNPWKKGAVNLTEQGRIFCENPKLAERLKQEAMQ